MVGNATKIVRIRRASGESFCVGIGRQLCDTIVPVGWSPPRNASADKVKNCTRHYNKQKDSTLMPEHSILNSLNLAILVLLTLPWLPKQGIIIVQRLPNEMFLLSEKG